MNKKIYFKNCIDHLINSINNPKYDFSNYRYDINYIKGFPVSLYKYKPFNKYSWEEINDGKLYLAPAKLMDDQFDCSSNYSKEYIKSLSNEEIREKSLKYYRNYFKNAFGGVLPKDKKSQLNEVLRLYSFDEREYRTNKFLLSKRMGISEEKIDTIKNNIDSFFQELFEKSEFSKGFKKMFDIFRYQKEKTGLYALTETNTSQIMWQMYGNKYKGFCIEYDFSSWIDLNNKQLYDIVPVRYEYKYEHDPIKIVIKGVLDKFLLGKDEREIIHEYLVEYFLILTTKHKEWSLQSEWRYIGIPETKVDAPPIKAIYLGKNVSKENKEKIIELADTKHFDVYLLKDNYITLSIDYEKIYDWKNK